MMGSFCYLCCGSSFVSPHLLCGGIDLGSENKSARSSVSCTLLFDDIGFACVLKRSLCMYKYTPPPQRENIELVCDYRRR